MVDSLKLGGSVHSNNGSTPLYDAVGESQNQYYRRRNAVRRLVMLSGAKIPAGIPRSAQHDSVTHALLPSSPYLGARASRPHACELPALPDSPTASVSHRLHNQFEIARATEAVREEASSEVPLDKIPKGGIIHTQGGYSRSIKAVEPAWLLGGQVWLSPSL